MSYPLNPRCFCKPNLCFHSIYLGRKEGKKRKRKNLAFQFFLCAFCRDHNSNFDIRVEKDTETNLYRPIIPRPLDTPVWLKLRYLASKIRVEGFKNIVSVRFGTPPPSPGLWLVLDETHVFSTLFEQRSLNEPILVQTGAVIYDNQSNKIFFEASGY